MKHKETPAQLGGQYCRPEAKKYNEIGPATQKVFSKSKKKKKKNLICSKQQLGVTTYQYCAPQVPTHVPRTRNELA